MEGPQGRRESVWPSAKAGMRWQAWSMSDGSRKPNASEVSGMNPIFGRQAFFIPHWWPGMTPNHLTHKVSIVRLTPRWLTVMRKAPSICAYQKGWALWPCSHESIIVKSRSTPVGGPVKSGWRQTKDKGRGLDKRLVQPELVTAWIQWLRIMSIDPLHRFRSRGDGDGDGDGDGQELE